MPARSRRLDAKHVARSLVAVSATAFGVASLGAVARGQDPAASARTVEWTQLRPVKLVSAGGATFTPNGDGSISVSGPNPEKDVWTLDFETDVQGITAVRLEALADDALPCRGPGRAFNGNFVLNEMILEASAKLALRYKPVTLQNASADFVEGARKATQVHDGDTKTGGNGWAVYGAIGRDHQLIAETKSDVKFDGGGAILLRFELHFNWGQQHELGRFRMSATNAPRPVLVPGSAGTEPFSKLQERINGAIDRGVGYLEGEQLLDGSWAHEPWTYRNGATALTAYTLVKSGVSKKHPAVVRALECMRGAPVHETYSLGCMLMALGAMDDPTLVPWMKELTDQLLGLQKLGFTYGWKNDVDLSNTQYGVLGLRAAALHGVGVPDQAFEAAAQQALLFEHGDNVGAYAPVGFSYNRPSKPTGSMTAAGAGILAIADEQLRAKGKGGLYLSQAKRGVDWLAAHWSVEKNLFDATDRWNLYYLYGLERVGSVLQVEKIGDHDWYREGARRLVDTQGGKGEWGSSYGDHVIDTCFALLFLNKATAVASGKSNTKTKNYGSDDPQQPVSLRASGDTPLTMWISGFGATELARHAWPNESDRGLHVKSVQYVASGGAYGAAEQVVATTTSDGLQPCGREKFGAQSSFPLPGHYRLFARVTVLDPPEAAALATKASVVDASASKQVELVSPALELDVEEALDPELLQYARDPARNLVAGQKVTASASSQINGDWQPGFAFDNLQSRGWAAKNDDPSPTLTLELERPVRVTTVLLTPAKIGDLYNSRITKVQLTVNGRPPPIVVDVPDTPQRRKIRVHLPQATIVRKLEVKVLEKKECANAEKAVGFAEVELQADKPGENK